MIFLAPQAGSPTVSNAIDRLGALIDEVLDYAILLAAVGAVAMALVEAFKKIVDARAKFHARRWTRFMKLNGYAATQLPDKEDAFVQLLQLSCGVNQQEASEAVYELTGSAGPQPQPRLGMRGPSDLNTRLAKAMREHDQRQWTPTLLGQPKAAYSVFAQSTDQMVATLGDAADVALASPTSYESLFNFLVRGAEPEDIEAWRNPKATAPAEPGESDKAKKKRAVAAREAAGALSRLRLVARRKLAAFQLFTTQSWASWNQLWANALGIVIMAVVLFQLDRSYLEIAIGGVFGGVLSPVAKDVVSALSRAKADLKQADE